MGVISDRMLMRRCSAVVRDLDRTVGIPRPFDLDRLVAALEVARGRPIELCALGLDELAAGVCGLWLDLSDRDVVVFPAPAVPNHRDHIALHEIGHMLAGHRGASGTSAIALLTPDLDPTVVRAVLARSAYGERQEREAELISSLVLARSLGAAARQVGRDGERDGADARGVADRVEHAFGPGRR